MKFLAAFLCLVAAANLARAETTPSAKPVNPKDAPLVVVAADPNGVSPKPVDPKAAPGAKKEVKKETPLPKIPGIVINRANGNFLSLQLAGSNFSLTFYDKKHKLMAIDVTRATARWPNPRAPGDNRTVLNGSGSTLVGAKPVLPPYNFTVYLTLLQGEGDDAKAVESYTVPFSG